MAIPKIFVSSTFSDLKNLRNDISSFIRDQGYEPITFENNDITVGLNETLEYSLEEEIKSCSMLILIIGARYGSSMRIPTAGYEDKKTSYSQFEYRVARNNGIPIFTFIEHNVLDEFNRYIQQGKAKNFAFSNIDGTQLAEFIEEVHHGRNFLPIKAFTNTFEIKQLLTKQWAGLFQKYLQDARKHTMRQKEIRRINPFELPPLKRRRILGFSFSD